MIEARTRASAEQIAIEDEIRTTADGAPGAFVGYVPMIEPLEAGS